MGWRNRGGNGPAAISDAGSPSVVEHLELAPLDRHGLLLLMLEAHLVEMMVVLGIVLVQPRIVGRHLLLLMANHWTVVGGIRRTVELLVR